MSAVYISGCPKRSSNKNPSVTSPLLNIGLSVFERNNCDKTTFQWKHFSCRDKQVVPAIKPDLEVKINHKTNTKSEKHVRMNTQYVQITSR
jgi:hypothetical protein